MADVREAGVVNKSVVLGIATMASFLVPYMESSVNIALPSIATEFKADAISLSWVATSYLLAAAVLLLPAGRIADISGRKRVFIWGISIYTLSSFLAATSTSTGMLIAFRIIEGIGAAMIFSTGVAIVTTVFVAGERGRALGITVAAVYLGLTLGPFLGGFLTDNFGWRSIFLTILPLGVLTIGVILWKLKTEWAEARGEAFDLVGSLIYAAGIIAIIYGFTVIPNMWGFVLEVVGFAVLAVFLRWESTSQSPVLRVSMFRDNRVFAFSNLAALINYSAVFAVGFLLSLYLQYIHGLDPFRAGLALVIMPGIQAVFSPIAGRLSDRFEPRIISSLGMALTFTGLLALTFIGSLTSLEYITFWLAFLGLGFALFSSPNVNAIMSSVENRVRGVASAILATMRLTGQMFSLAIATLLLHVYVGRMQILPPDYPYFLNAAHVAFMVFAGLCFAGIFFSLARGRIHGRH